jgi:hypothetical protein
MTYNWCHCQAFGGYGHTKEAHDRVGEPVAESAAQPVGDIRSCAHALTRSIHRAVSRLGWRRG